MPIRLLVLGLMNLLLAATAARAEPAPIDLTRRFCFAVTEVAHAKPPAFGCAGAPEGYESRRLWLRADLNAADSARGAALVVHQSRFDRLAVSFAYADGTTVDRVVHAGAYRDFWRVGGNLVFEAPPRAARLTSVTLAFDRLASVGLLRARLLPPDIQGRDATIAAALVGGALTLLALSVIYNLALFVASRRYFVAWHAAWVGSVLVWGLIWSQLAYVAVPGIAGTWASKICTILSALAVAFATLCAATSFEPGTLPRWARRGLGALAVIGTGLGVAVALAGHDVVMQIAPALSAAILSTLVAVVAAIAWSWRRGSRAARDFALAWSLPMAVLALTEFVDLGSRLFGGGSQFAVLLASAGQTIWLSVATTLRLAALRAERDAARAAQAELRELAIRDPLTGLLNRRGFVAFAQRMMSAPAPQGGFNLLLLDVDHFKSINDRYGHDQGDRALQGIAARLQDAGGEDIIIGRLGGEEFGIGIAAGAAGTAAALAERLRAAVAEHHLRDVAADDLAVTISIGVAAAEPGEEFEALYRRADQALYRAKRAGRDRVAIAATLSTRQETAAVA